MGNIHIGATLDEDTVYCGLNLRQFARLSQLLVIIEAFIVVALIQTHSVRENY